MLYAYSFLDFFLSYKHIWNPIFLLCQKYFPSARAIFYSFLTANLAICKNLKKIWNHKIAKLALQNCNQNKHFYHLTGDIVLLSTKSTKSSLYVYFFWTFTVLWSDYRFSMQMLWGFFHPHLRIRSKTSAYIYRHLL
jgi:hypothetical protein